MRVKKNIFVGAALAAALVIPAAVQGATPQQLFVGDFDDQEETSVKLKTGVGQGYAVKAFGAHDFAVECSDETTAGAVNRAAIKGRFPIGKRGAFHVRDDNGKTVINIRGEVGKGKATGVFRFSGELVGANDKKHSCDSGRLEWTARIE